jgi:hypothetical protein
VRVTARGPAAVPGHWVVMHRATQQGGAPVDSVRTDGRGRWRMRIAAVDTVAVYLVTATWDGITYVSRPIHPGPRSADTVQTLAVYDTTFGRPPVVVAQRFITIRPRERDGTRQVMELVELANRGATTRIARDSTDYTWAGALPTFAAQFQVGESDVSAETVVRSGNRITVFAPISPASTHQISYAYIIPGNVADALFPVDQATETLLLAIEDTVLTVSGLPFEDVGTRTLDQGRSFRGFKLDSVAGGSAFTVHLGRAAISPSVYIAIVVGLAALALGYGLYRAIRRPLAR